MDAAELERVYEAVRDFHDYLPGFGRRETQDHGRHYLRALLVQSQERRNAENLSEAGSPSPHRRKRPMHLYPSSACGGFRLD